MTELAVLGRAAHASRTAAAVLRWAGACVAGFAALLALSVALAGFERNGAVEAAETSASAYLDFDLAVLRALADRSLAGQDGLTAVWARRPDWQIAAKPSNRAQLAPLRDAWTAVVSEKSRFRTAARGTADALPFLLGGLALALLAAAVAGAWSKNARVALVLAIAFAAPLWLMLDPGAFYDRTRSLGTGLAAALFVAAFAAALPGAAFRALFARRQQIAPARLAAIDAVQWLIPAIPALATAALFVCAKADQDPAARGAASGFGGLIRAAMAEASAGDRLASCALLAGGLALLSFLGHRFVVEARAALGAGR
ncbi:MAG: hypothetical protein ABR567_01925 [Myxococcales bacterium]|nr:hypothetical protein [Myxococcales bacterium]